MTSELADKLQIECKLPNLNLKKTNYTSDWRCIIFGIVLKQTRRLKRGGGPDGTIQPTVATPTGMATQLGL